MLETSHPQQSPTPTLPLDPDRVEFAAWPPDDGDAATPPAGGGVPSSGGFDPGDGDFKKGKMKPAVVLGIIAALLIAGIVFFAVGAKQEEESLNPEKAAEEKKRILVLPQKEQLPRWREYAKSDVSDYLKEEALKQLAWARDPQGVDLAIAALKHIEQPIRARAAQALAEYGSPAADKAKPALLAALKEAGPESRPQIAWALVELGESSAFEEIMKLYRAGHLSGVRRLDGRLAFDPNKIVALKSLDEFSELYKDESPAVRQLVATVLSRNADKKYTDKLIALVQDPDGDISHQAAPGLGKIGDERARTPLLEKLKGADVDQRVAYLKALQDGIGTPGLVLAIDSITTDDKTKAWHQTQQIFKRIRELAHPGGGDALVGYIETKPNIHWQTMAAFALAEVADLRAVPTLAKRLRMDALKIYSDETDYEMMLKRDNKERVVAARMLADLAQLYPDRRAELRDQSEDALIFWIHEKPAPHANGLRALAAMESDKDLQALRDWANPKVPLPLEGQQPPMPREWEIAQSALRYVGWMKDERSWGVLLDQLKRRPEKLDATMDGLYGGGVAMLGMALRAIGVGAAHGLAEWGDPKAFEPLLKYIDGTKENEQSRMAACEALAWVATDEDMIKVAEKISEYSSDSNDDQVRRQCLLETLVMRPLPGTSEPLLALLSADSSMNVRHQVARAIGKAGLDGNVEAQLFEKMKDEQLMTDAWLALALGGSPDTAARALAMFADKPRAVLEELQELWYKSFGYWSHEDLEKGHLFRFVSNAQAMSRVEFKDAAQEWAGEQLRRQFDNLIFDNGPHSFTRVVLRKRLYDMARGKDEAKRAGAINVLEFMKEQGVLLSLRDVEGPAGKLAAEAYHNLLNPKVATGVKDFSEDEKGE